MEKLKRCPLCGGETLLCKNTTGYASVLPEFSVLCLGCRMEFKRQYHPGFNIAPYLKEPMKAAEDLVTKFNTRCALNMEEDTYGKETAPGG